MYICRFIAGVFISTVHIKYINYHLPLTIPMSAPLWWHLKGPRGRPVKEGQLELGAPRNHPLSLKQRILRCVNEGPIAVDSTK